jgi:hypothetical protein
MKIPKGKKKTPPRKRAAAKPPAESAHLAPEERIVMSDLTLHQLFQQQTAVMLDHADLSEEQKQSILIGMSCPCCGAGGFSYTAKLKRGI